ncbi:MAG: hypothetical protein KDA96_16935 [Planctomycetaceae bacterium]|nr:hypothetical protein [Planctomycetaceae bacterium]
MRRLRLIIGAVAWVAAATAVVGLADRRSQQAGTSVTSVLGDVSGWTVRRRLQREAQSDRLILLAAGDPVIAFSEDGTPHQVGFVRSNRTPERKASWTKQADVCFYPGAIDDIEHLKLEYRTASTSLDWVVQTMLPPDRQKEIAKLIAAEWDRQHDDVLKTLEPIVQETLRRTVAEIRADLPSAIERHRPEITALGEKYQTQMLQQRLVPLVRDKILPIVHEESAPIASDVGRRLWNRVSVWGFTWRYLYDVSPLPERHRVRKEFDRFLEEEAMPELAGRSDQFVELTERIVNRVGKDPVVREALREALNEISDDPELHAIIRNLLQEMLSNPHLRHSLQQYWSSEEVRLILRGASQRFEPTARAIGDLIFGTRENGVSPEFAEVLRVQILEKDRRWLVVSSGDEGETAGRPMKIVWNPQPSSFPLKFKGERQSELADTPGSEPVLPPETAR